MAELKTINIVNLWRINHVVADDKINVLISYWTVDYPLKILQKILALSGGCRKASGKVTVLHRDLMQRKKLITLKAQNLILGFPKASNGLGARYHFVRLKWFE